MLTFLIFQAIPNGDPAQRLAGGTSTPETVDATRRTWGFDKPIYDQYLLTMKHVFTGDVISYTQQVNVEQEVLQDLPPTLSPAIGAGVIWLGFGVALGLLTAARAGGLIDRGLTVLALVGVSTPVFLLGAVLLYLLAYRLGRARTCSTPPTRTSCARRAPRASVNAGSSCGTCSAAQ